MGEGPGEKRELFNLTKLKGREAQSARDSRPKQPLLVQGLPKWISPCNAIPGQRKTGWARQRRAEDLAETDCWLERLLGGREAVQWGHKGLNMSTDTVRTECVCVCVGNPVERGMCQTWIWGLVGIG